MIEFQIYLIYLKMIRKVVVKNCLVLVFLHIVGKQSETIVLGKKKSFDESEHFSWSFRR